MSGPVSSSEDQVAIELTTAGPFSNTGAGRNKDGESSDSRSNPDSKDGGANPAARSFVLNPGEHRYRLREHTERDGQINDETYPPSSLSIWLSWAMPCCCLCIYSNHPQKQAEDEPSDSSPSDRDSGSSRNSKNNCFSSSELSRDMRIGRWLWRVFLLSCWVVGLILMINSSGVLYGVCQSDSLGQLISDLRNSGDLTAAESDVCILYFWLYLWLDSMLVCTLIFYCTYRLTMNINDNDVRGDRILCLMNLVQFSYLIYLLSFFELIRNMLYRGSDSPCSLYSGDDDSSSDSSSNSDTVINSDGTTTEHDDLRAECDIIEQRFLPNSENCIILLMVASIVVITHERCIALGLQTADVFTWNRLCARIQRWYWLNSGIPEFIESNCMCVPYLRPYAADSCQIGQSDEHQKLMDFLPSYMKDDRDGNDDKLNSDDKDEVDAQRFSMMYSGMGKSTDYGRQLDGEQDTHHMNNDDNEEETQAMVTSGKRESQAALLGSSSMTDNVLYSGEEYSDSDGKSERYGRRRNKKNNNYNGDWMVNCECCIPESCRSCWLCAWMMDVWATMVGAASHVIWGVLYLDKNNMRLAWTYVWSEIRRNRFSFYIGLFTVFIAVFIATLLPTVSDKTPVVFLKLAENEAGENDLLLTANLGNSDAFVDATSVTSEAYDSGYSKRYEYNDENDDDNGEEDLQIEYLDVTIDIDYAEFYNEYYSEINFTAFVGRVWSNLTNLLNMTYEEIPYEINLTEWDNSRVSDRIMNATGLSNQQLTALVFLYNNGVNDLLFDDNETLVFNSTDEAMDAVMDFIVDLNGTLSDNLVFSTSIRIPYVTGDVLLDSQSAELLNFTFVEGRMSDRMVDEVDGLVPRWWLLANATAAIHSDSYVESDNPEDELANNTADDWKIESCIVLVIDSERERDIGIGRSWENRGILEFGQAWSMDTVTRGIGYSTSNKNNPDSPREFLLFSNLGGLQYSYDVDLASLFLDTQTSVDLEESLVGDGRYLSCIQLEITFDEELMNQDSDTPDLYEWIIYDADLNEIQKQKISDYYDNSEYDDNDESDDSDSGSMITITSSCAYIKNFTGSVVFDDQSGSNGLGSIGGYYNVYWDNSELYFDNGISSFNDGTKDVRNLTRPSDSYGNSTAYLTDRDDLDNDDFNDNGDDSNNIEDIVIRQLIGQSGGDSQGDALQGIFDVVFSDEFRSIYTGLLYGGNTKYIPVIEALMPDYNTTEMVSEMDGSSYNRSIELLFDWFVYYVGGGIELETKRSVKSGDGKWSAVLGSIVAVDYTTVQEYFEDTTESLITGIELAAALFGVEATVEDSDNDSDDDNSDLSDQSLRVEDFAVQIILMYRDRLTAYLSDTQTMEDYMAKFTNAVFSALDLDFACQTTLPVFEQLRFLSFFRQFMGLVLVMCIALIISLALLLIYALLLNDADERTYTYGMLRALGMKHVTLVEIMLLKGASFSIPATAVALLLCFIVNIPIAQWMADYAVINVSIWLPIGAVVSGLVVGFVMPLLAIYLPTRRALGKTLRDSLDVSHHTVSETTVTMVKLAEVGLSPPVVAVAVCLVVMGAVFSIGIPYSVFERNFDLFFGIFGGLMLAMVYGMCLMSALLTAPVAAGLVKMWLHRWSPLYKHGHLKQIVLKNIASHSMRNMKTSLMFVICLGFCIFAGCSAAFMQSSVVNFLRWAVGSDIVMFVPWIDLTEGRNRIDSLEVRSYLDKQINEGLVSNYSYQSFALDDYNDDWYATLSSLAGTPQITQWIICVDRNYLDSTFSSFTNIKKYRKPSSSNSDVKVHKAKHSGGNPDVIKLLYDDAGNAELSYENNEDIPSPIIGSGFFMSNDRCNECGSSDYSGNIDIDYTIDHKNESYNGYYDILIASSLSSALSVISVDDAMTMHLDTGDNSTLKYLLKPRAIVDKLPGIVMLPYQLQFASFLAAFQNAIITCDAIEEVIAEAYNFTSVEQAKSLIIRQSLMIRMSKDSSSADYSAVKQGLRNFVPNQEIQLFDMRETSERTEANLALLTTFFLVLGVIGMCLSFLILWLSFLSNIRNASWEIGVLRSLGLDKLEVSMIFIYEALSLVCACIIFGTVIGTFTAFMLISQFNLFLLLELDMMAVYPYELYFTIVSIALFVAVLGSLMPMREYISNNVSKVLRM